MGDDERSDSDDADPTSQSLRELGSEMGLGSIVAHLYRGEMDRVINWRTRLDSTTNFAVTVIGAVLAYAFSGQGAGHTVVLVGIMIGTVFLLIEARRYQLYDVWRSRARVLQENLFANALDPSAGVEQRDWRAELSRDYRQPSAKMAYHVAVAHRLRRVYLPLLGGLGAVWLFRLAAYGDDGLVDSAAIEGVSGTIVLGTVAAFYAALLGLAIAADTRGETSGSDHAQLDRRR
ncbi:DUF2270 domain-containing protein [Natronoarchaeum mannanilyticum]|uniref:DUF2270 domain-containing protein n=1 Tax=Natronoarchaeum mannanilyticum TaxID=926360 RepID=A0AAV3T9R3_9EURY